MKRPYRRAILWFRNDLRIHDNEALKDALSYAQEVVPVFVFDERVFHGKTSFGFKKTGIHRSQFLIESVQLLKDRLKELSSDLVIKSGKTEEVLFELAKEYKTNWIFCNRERTEEEVEIQDALEKKLWTIGQEIRYSRGKMLYYTSDLPFPINHAPDNFYQYRKEVERYIPVRDPLEEPESPFSPLTIRTFSDDIPTLQDLGHDPEGYNSRYRGGEENGLLQVKDFLAVANKSKTSQRSLLTKEDDSSHFSAWLAVGALSPKTIYAETYGNKRKPSKGSKNVFSGLLWRDFYRLMGKKHGNHIFKKGGISQDKGVNGNNDRDAFLAWANAKTGNDIVDAIMNELNTTGWISSLARQIVSYYLINELKVNWVMGAEYFESLLIDYDPCSNYGNWNVMADVLADTKETMSFNLDTLADKYDADHSYRELWSPN